MLGSIAFISQVYEGATASLWFAGVQVSATIIIFTLSISVGSGRFLNKNDHIILLAASVGLVLWYFTETAVYSLAISISISLLGGLATMAKAYRAPESETLSTWVISLVASIFAIFSVGRLDPIILAYPFYLFTLSFALVAAILFGRVRRNINHRTLLNSICINEIHGRENYRHEGYGDEIKGEEDLVALARHGQ